MRHVIVPAIVFLLMLAGCAEGGSGGAPTGSSGSGGNPAVLSVVTAEMPNAIQNGYYYAQIRSVGGTGPYTWSVNGILPTGLTLTQSTGQVAVIEGVPPNYTWSWAGGAAPPPPPPNTDDPCPFDLTVTDGAGHTSVRRLITIVDAATTSTVASRGITDSTVGCEFSARFNAVGGTAGAYTWSVASGTLPPGLTLANVSVAEAGLAGVPTTSGTYNFTVQANVGATLVGTAACSMTVFAAGQTLSLEPLGATHTFDFNVFPTADFLASLNALGGTGGYKWRVSSGTLPTGLELRSDGDQHAALAGTVSQQGTFNWQMELTDNGGHTFTTSVTMNVFFLPPP